MIFKFLLTNFIAANHCVQSRACCPIGHQPYFILFYELSSRSLFSSSPVCKMNVASWMSEVIVNSCMTIVISFSLRLDNFIYSNKWTIQSTKELNKQVEKRERSILQYLYIQSTQVIIKIIPTTFQFTLERALRALASSSGGAACPGATRDQPRGSTPGVRG